MAHLRLDVGAEPMAGNALPHQSTVAAILSAARLGLFTMADAELMVDRVRSLSIKDSRNPEES